VGRRIKHERNIRRNEGNRPRHVEYVANLVGLKKRYHFEPPSQPNTNLLTEQQLKEYGQQLHDEKKLRVAQTVGVEFPRQEAYRLFTILDPSRIPGCAISPAEERLYLRLSVLRKKKDKVEREEGNYFDTTTVFTSLGLLWNMQQCKDLEFKVTASADGTDKVTSNNYQTMMFGVHSINEYGTKQFRPFIFILAPGEREEFFIIGLLALLKYSRLVFGIVNVEFMGGIVSDHAAAFVNAFLIAFPKSKPNQCVPHLQRKFMTGGEVSRSKIERLVVQP